MSFLSTVAHVAQVLVNWFWVTIDGSWLHRGLARLLYFPSILRMTLKEGPNRRWYDRIDDTVILGALPFRSQTKKLVEEEEVKAVLSYNEAYELNFFTNTKKEWEQSGVDQHWHNTIDFQPPTLPSITAGLRVIATCKQRRQGVYVHCKAGKGRSAIVVACYLMKEHRFSPHQAIEYMKQRRPQIHMNIRQRQRLTEFHQQLNTKKE